MILFHAPGGGLGHAMRVLAILNSSPALARRSRVLLSSQWTERIAPCFPCPVSRIPAETFAAKSYYFEFLEAYLRRHRIHGVVQDAFPLGLFGEWRHVGRGLPRLLMARDLKWPDYLARIGPGEMPASVATLCVEPLSADYLAFLQAWGEVMFASSPLTPDPTHFPRPDWQARKPWLVVHSGGEGEKAALLELVRQHGGEGECDCLFPEMGIFPAAAVFSQYECVVSGAGYHATAEASLAPVGRRHLLHPFPRVLDDQAARGQRFLEGRQWESGQDRSVAQATDWIVSLLC